MRQQQPALRMTPAQQRFDRCHAPGRHFDRGLVLQHEFLAVERLAQAVFKLDALDHVGVHGRAEKLEAAAPVLLGVVHRNIGVVQQGVDFGAIVRAQRDADRGRQRHFLAADVDRQRHGLGHGEGHVGGLVGALDVGQQHDELVAAQPADGVDLAHAGAHPQRHFTQHDVAGLVAVGVVDGLELVEVEEHDGGAAALAAPGGQRLVQAVQEQDAVGQAREGVVLGLVAHLLFDALALADVGQHRHIARHLAMGIANGRQRDAHRIALAVAARAGQFAFPVVGALEPGPDALIEVVVDAPAEAGQRLADDLLGRMPGDGGEGAIDGAHAVLGIHHDDGVACILEHLRSLLEIGLGLFARRDVDFHAEHFVHHVVVLDGIVARIDPVAPARHRLHQPVACLWRLAGAPDGGDDVFEFALAVEVEYQVAKRAADGVARRDAVQLFAGVVPEADDAGAVHRVHGNGRRQLEGRDEMVEPVEGLYAAPGWVSRRTTRGIWQ